MKSGKYIFRKFIFLTLTIWGVISLLFLLFQLLSDPTTLLQGQRSDLTTKKNMEEELGLNKPALIRYINYLNDLSPISIHDIEKVNQLNYIKVVQINNKLLVLKSPYLGQSYQSKKPVIELLKEYFPGTLILASLSMGLAFGLGIILGSFSAIKQNSFLDQSIIGISTIGVSVPSFFSAIIISWFFGFVIHDFTGLSMTGSWKDYIAGEGEKIMWLNLILPSLALGIRPLAVITQLTRSSMIEVLGSEYIRTAKAKGLNKFQIIKRHALKNALNPVITASSGWFASLLAGSFFVEYIFGWKGIGKLTVESLEKSDYPVVMGCVLLVASLFIIINTLVDISYKYLDPRVEINQ